MNIRLTATIFLISSALALSSVACLADSSSAVEPKGNDSDRVANVHQLLLNCYLRLRKFKEAESEFKQLLDIRQRDADLHRNYAEFLMNLGRSREAQKHFAEAHELGVNAAAPLYEGDRSLPKTDLENLSRIIQTIKHPKAKK